METIDLQRKWDLTLAEVDRLREQFSGTYGVRTGHWTQRENGLWEPTSDWEYSGNIVTNEGLNHVLTATLDGGTQITAWYVAAVKTNTTAAAGMTYNSPTFTEIAGSDVTESTREAWTGGTVSSQSVDNSASVATYTANTTVTLYGAGLVGGGTGATTIADTAGGGTLYSYSLFASSKAMTSSDTIDITYTFTAADS